MVTTISVSSLSWSWLIKFVHEFRNGAPKIIQMLPARPVNFLNTGAIENSVSIRFSSASLRRLKRLFGLPRQAQAKSKALIYHPSRKVGKGNPSKWLLARVKQL